MPSSYFVKRTYIKAGTTAQDVKLDLVPQVEIDLNLAHVVERVVESEMLTFRVHFILDTLTPSKETHSQTSTMLKVLTVWRQRTNQMAIMPTKFAVHTFISFTS